MADELSGWLYTIKTKLNDGRTQHLNTDYLLLACIFTIGKCTTKICLFKYTENFTSKNENFQIKNSYIFYIYAQNIDYGYSLEPPQ